MEVKIAKDLWKNQSILKKTLKKDEKELEL